MAHGEAGQMRGRHDAIRKRMAVINVLCIHSGFASTPRDGILTRLRCRHKRREGAKSEGASSAAVGVIGGALS